MLYAVHDKIKQCNWNVMKFVNGISGYISMNDKTNLLHFRIYIYERQNKFTTFQDRYLWMTKQIYCICVFKRLFDVIVMLNCI